MRYPALMAVGLAVACVLVSLGACDPAVDADHGRWHFEARGTGATACSCVPVAARVVAVPVPVFVKAPPEAVAQ